MSTPEGTVKRDIKAALEATKAPLWYFMPLGGRFGVAGVPDFVGCVAGRFFAIEAKTKVGRTTKLQLNCLSLIKAAGGICGVVKPQEGVSISQQIDKLFEDIVRGG